MTNNQSNSTMQLRYQISIVLLTEAIYMSCETCKFYRNLKLGTSMNVQGIPSSSSQMMAVTRGPRSPVPLLAMTITGNLPLPTGIVGPLQQPYCPHYDNTLAQLFYISCIIRNNKIFTSVNNKPQTLHNSKQFRAAILNAESNSLSLHRFVNTTY